MNLFGDFYSRAYSFKVSKKERQMRQSEDWSAAILAGSSEKIQIEEPIHSRFLWLFGVVFLIIGSILIGRLAYLQIIKGQQNSVLASGNRVRITSIAAPRGTMYDRNGVVLVRNDARFDVVVTPSQMPQDGKKRSEQISLLSKIVGQENSNISKIIEDKGYKYPQQVLIAENITREQALQVEEQLHNLNGFSVDVNPSREYLDGGTLAPFLGYIGRISAEEWQKNPSYRPVDLIGKTGLEKAYETDLRGNYGKEQTEVDASGLPVRYLAKVEPQAGNSLVLSIDKALQDVMYAQLKAGVERAGASAGSVVAIDPRNGQVLGAVNYPSYDGNLFARGISQDQYNALLNNPTKPLFNRVAQAGYPIGSTSKPFVSVAALQEGVINPGTSIQDKGKLDVPNQYNPSIIYTFKGWKPEGLGTVNLSKALAWSSDIYYYIVGGGFESFRGLGPNKLTDWYKKFGFGAKTGADIGDEATGFVPTPEGKKKYSKEPWYVGDTYNISIGQGDMRITPLQLANATAAIANGGTLFKPHFASSIKNLKGELVRNIEPEVAVANIASPEHIAQVKAGMETVVESGTACCSMKAVVPVKVAGKTGTAETSSQGFDGKNPVTKPHAWFSAYAPANNPMITTVVMIENAGEGSEFALPVTTEILRWYFSTPRN